MDQPAAEPHVLMFPFPAQGHVNSMLKLAELLCLAGLQVTFLISNQTHSRLLRYTNFQSRFSPYPDFRLEIVPENVFYQNRQSDEEIMNLFLALETTVKPFLVDYLASGCNRKPVSCLIADGIMSFANDFAQEICIPVFYFRTVSACCVWANFWIPELVDAGELPFKGDDLDVPIVNVPGMEGFLRRRDLPTMHREGDTSDHSYRMLLNKTWQTTRTHPVIFNTFEDLEGPILSHIRTKCPKAYTIGPLHAHLKAKLAEKNSSHLASSNSLWEEDKSCIKWLDNQPLKSVIYVSFGSVAMVTRDQFMELWHGLVNSGIRFLWVRRPNSVAGKDVEDQISAELEEGTKARGYIVGWAPQEIVLAHPAVGGFLTHSGWNSTLESIFEGMPMICWSYFADQMVNSRFVEEVWKLGLDIKGTCNRIIIEKAVRDLMELRKDEFFESADRMSKLARKCLSEGGSSRCNFDRLIEDIRSMAVVLRS